MVELDWMSSIHVCKEPRLRSATIQEVEIVGPIMLHVRMEEAPVWVVFDIDKNLAVSVLLETFIIDKFVKGTIPA